MDEKIKKEFEDIESEFQNVQKITDPKLKIGLLDYLKGQAEQLLVEAKDSITRDQIEFLIKQMDNEIKLTRDSDKNKNKKVKKQKENSLER